MYKYRRLRFYTSGTKKSFVTLLFTSFAKFENHILQNIGAVKKIIGFEIVMLLDILK